MGIGVLLLVAAAQFSASDDIAASLSSTLAGRGGNVAMVQRALADTLGRRAATPSGVVVTGDAPSVEELASDALSGEIADGAEVRHYLRVNGRGPRPLRVRVPLPDGAGTPKAWQRVMSGVFLETDSRLEPATGALEFECAAPGEYVVASAPEKANFGDSFLPSSPPPSRDPALRGNWRLFRVAPELIRGATPLLLIHGVGTDRWEEFTEWASSSPEAEEFRRHYQLWNFQHEMAGINSAVGYDKDCPTYRESTVAALVDFLAAAETEGVETDGVRYYWPRVPFSILTNSHGGLKARAFMVNHPEYGEQVLACVTLGGPHLGTPPATVEWLRHTASRMGLGRINLMAWLADMLIRVEYFSVSRQGDLDAGWLNTDAAAGKGIPHKAFRWWDRENGEWNRRVLSPRDGNSTGARELAEYGDDLTFEPQERLDNYCGGIDLIHPAKRGDLYTDRLFLYGSYLQGNPDILGMLIRSNDGIMPGRVNFFENIGLHLAATIMGLFASPGASWPYSAYRINDGFVPLQSQLLLDGAMTEPVYKTWDIAGWRLPVFPFQVDMDLMREHTLGNPERLRLYPGWTHLETVTGRYSRSSGHSELFCAVAGDLLGVL